MTERVKVDCGSWIVGGEIGDVEDSNWRIEDMIKIEINKWV